MPIEVKFGIAYTQIVDLVNNVLTILGLNTFKIMIQYYLSRLRIIGRDIPTSQYTKVTNKSYTFIQILSISYCCDIA